MRFFLTFGQMAEIFSTMITVASTIRPKSMAPTDSKLADSPRKVMMMMAKNMANGIVALTMIALRRLPRNTHCTMKISTIPNNRFSMTVCVVTPISSLRS